MRSGNVYFEVKGLILSNEEMVFPKIRIVCEKQGAVIHFDHFETSLSGPGGVHRLQIYRFQGFVKVDKGVL